MTRLWSTLFLLFLAVSISLDSRPVKLRATQSLHRCRAEAIRLLGGRVGTSLGPALKPARSSHGTNTLAHPRWLRRAGELLRSELVAPAWNQRLRLCRKRRPMETDVGRQPGRLSRFRGRVQRRTNDLQREATSPNGAKFIQRMVWKNITANELDWSWEASRDGGKTWQVKWPLHYKRKN